MKIGIISLFPEMFAALKNGITGRAIKSGLLSLNFWNPRDYVSLANEEKDNYRAVDDRPYGGGPGMVMKVEPLFKAIKVAKNALGDTTQVLHMSPQGKQLKQADISKLAKESTLLLVASRYEGVDQRLIELAIDEEWSMGDYILSGGELPAMVLIDGVTRLLPGALGHPHSAEQDSFMNGLLDCPHYTRPEVFADKKVPAVLLKGNHQAIASWRLQQALGRTWLYRPDLLKNRVLTPVEQQLLNDFIREARGETHE